MPQPQFREIIAKVTMDGAFYGETEPQWTIRVFPEGETSDRFGDWLLFDAELWEGHERKYHRTVRLVKKGDLSPLQVLAFAIHNLMPIRETEPR